MEAERKQQLIEALATILDAVEAHDKEQEPRLRADPNRFKPISFSELMQSDELDSFVDDPVGRALRAGVREFGRRLAKKYTFEDLHYIAHTAAEKRGRFGHRIDVVDKRWDGLVTFDGAPWVA